MKLLSAAVIFVNMPGKTLFFYISVILMLLLVSTGLFSLDNISEKSMIIPLGWSTDSKFSCVKCELVRNNTVYRETFYIIDAVTDQIIIEEVIFIADKADSREQLTDKYNAAGKKIEVYLKQYDIRRDGSLFMKKFPVTGSDAVFSPELVPSYGKEGKKITGFDLFIRSGKGSKKLTRVTDMDPPSSVCFVDGYFVSPFEPRIIVVVSASGENDANEPFHHVYLIGCLLSAGFGG